MDKNEQNLKVEELKTAMQKREIEKAVEIADALDLKKIKDNNFLSLVADAYEMAHKYHEAKKVLLLAYENTNAGRQLAYRLCLIAVKTKEYDEAMEFYGDFVDMAPRDTARYILRYKMAKAKGDSIEKLIDILEEYVNIDMEEKWAYELAKLYHMAGDEEKCVDMCDEISLWFAEGKYVVKALELKRGLRPLTASQQEKYEEGKRKNVEEAVSVDVEEIAADTENDVEKPEESEKLKEDEKTEISETLEEVMESKDSEKIEETEEFEKSEELEEIEIEDIPKIEIGDIAEIKIEPVLDEKFNTMDIQEVVAEGIKQIIADDELVNIHEGEGATKVAQGRGNEELRVKNEEPQNSEELIVKSEESEQQNEESQDVIGDEPINDIKGVEDILRQLQKRGILKAETVNQAVNIIDGAETQNNEELRMKNEERRQENEELRMKNEERRQENEELQDDEEFDDDEYVVPEFLKSKSTAAGVPLFDLSYTSPKRDESNDIGQESMYENIVANSDLGNITDQLPTKEELDAAIKKAEETVGNSQTESPQTESVQTENSQTEKEQTESALHTQENLSAKVEIISGAVLPEKVVKTNTEIDNKLKANEKIISEDRNIEKEALPEQPKTALSEDELSAFRNYLNVEGFESNIKEVLQELIVNYEPNGKSSSGNVIIMGSEKTGKTTLAIELIKLVNRKRGRRNRKLAKINAEALNRRGFRNSMNKLIGSDLIVENADQLGAMILSEVVDVSGMYTDDMLIVFEGDAEAMKKMLQDYPRLSSVFNHVVQIREYDIKEWVEYGNKYAKSKGYGIDELANLACYKAIDDFFGENKGIGQSDVEEIIDNAINHSKRLGRKLSGMFTSKKDEEGLYILKESDFIK